MNQSRISIRKLRSFTSLSMILLALIIMLSGFQGMSINSVVEQHEVLTSPIGLASGIVHTIACLFC